MSTRTRARARKRKRTHARTHARALTRTHVHARTLSCTYTHSYTPKHRLTLPHPPIHPPTHPHPPNMHPRTRTRATHARTARTHAHARSGRRVDTWRHSAAHCAAWLSTRAHGSQVHTKAHGRARAHTHTPTQKCTHTQAQDRRTHKCAYRSSLTQPRSLPRLLGWQPHGYQHLAAALARPHTQVTSPAAQRNTAHSTHTRVHAEASPPL